MYQLTFSDQSLAELNHLEVSIQMKLMETLSALNFEELESNPILGRFARGKTIYNRVRIDDFRIYFERKEANLLYVHYILHKHTWNDFLFRFKLPFNDESAIEKDSSFWKFLESLKK